MHTHYKKSLPIFTVIGISITKAFALEGRFGPKRLPLRPGLLLVVMRN
jgi:hypothetical protein